MSAHKAARHWSAVGAPRLIKDRENAVYEITLADGARAALRLHRPGYQSDAAIRSELWWMARLVEAGLPVPRPLAADTGDLVVRAGGRSASVVSWVEGQQSGDGDAALPDDAQEVTTQYTRLGRLIARIHNATDALDLPQNFERPAWDRHAFLGDAPLWGQYWENPAMTPDEVRVVQAARKIMDRKLAELEEAQADFGLIHADLLRENVLVEDGVLSIIDFDDSGFGFRGYDLGTALVQALEDPMYHLAKTGIGVGYEEARHRGAVALGDIDLFVALRCFASAGWIVSRAGPDDWRMRFYAERAVRAARALAGET